MFKKVYVVYFLIFVFVLNRMVMSDALVAKVLWLLGGYLAIKLVAFVMLLADGLRLRDEVERVLRREFTQSFTIHEIADRVIAHRLTHASARELRWYSSMRWHVLHTKLFGRGYRWLMLELEALFDEELVEKWLYAIEGKPGELVYLWKAPSITPYRGPWGPRKAEGG